MPLHVAVFEDDIEMAELMKEILEHYHYQVTCHYDMKKPSWERADIILADFRNKFVPFEMIKQQGRQKGIPVVAISGDDTGFSPQVLKPFRIETLQKTIYQALIEIRTTA